MLYYFFIFSLNFSPMKKMPFLKCFCLACGIICEVFAEPVPDEIMQEPPYSKVGMVYNVVTGKIGTGFCIAERVIVTAKSNLEGNGTLEDSCANVRFYPGYHKVERPNPQEGIQLRKFYIYSSKNGMGRLLQSFKPDFHLSDQDIRRIDDIAVAIVEKNISVENHFKLAFLPLSDVANETCIFSYIENIFGVWNNPAFALGYGGENTSKLQSLAYVFDWNRVIFYPYFSLFLKNIASPGGFLGGPVFTKGEVDYSVFAIIIGNSSKGFSNIRVMTYTDITKLILPAIEEQYRCLFGGVDIREVSAL